MGQEKNFAVSRSREPACRTGSPIAQFMSNPAPQQHRANPNGNVTLPPIEVLRVGDFVSAEGLPVSFSADDLADIAESYDPALFQAPHVVGHPRMNDPAYGLVSGLSVVGDRLVAASEEVEPAFADMVRARRFKDRSVQVYPPSHRANPAPGKYYLKHVGWLGAAAPAVKGLAAVASFSGDDEALCLTISLSEKQNPQEKETQMTDKSNGRAAAVTDEQLTSLSEREAAVAEREAKAAKRDADFARDRIAALHADHVSFVESLIKGDGKGSNFKPANKAKAIALLDALAAEGVASFGEGDSAQPLCQVFKDMLTAQPTLISFGEFDKDTGRGIEALDELASFAVPSDHQVDKGSLAIHGRAVALQREKPDLAYMDAVSLAEREMGKGN